ncbi:MAG: class I SAM-dependent methyltransferase [Kineosporiaceae bacterium]
MSSPRDDAQRLDDLRALELLRPLLPGTYLPWTEASIRPAALVRVCNDVVIRRRRTVVEFGSGISTLVLSRLLAGAGGRLVTIEHDERWLAVVDGLVRAAGTGRSVHLHHAALVDGWYDRTVVAGALADAPGPVDLLLVDGPPAWRPGTELARWPAAEVVAPHLAGDATVVLDDVHRPGEQEIVRHWGDDHGWRFTTRWADDIAVAVLGGEDYAI